MQLCTIETVFDLQWFDLRFFDFAMVPKRYIFSKYCTSNFEFCSFHGLAICGMILSHYAGQWEQTSAPSVM